MTREGGKERERERGRDRGKKRLEAETRGGGKERKEEEEKRRERNKSGEKMERTDRLTNHETPLGYADRWGTLRGGPRGYAVEG